jgi:hypothetical protein
MSQIGLASEICDSPISAQPTRDLLEESRSCGD